MMIGFFLLLSLTAFSASDMQDAFDKSFPRDNTFCSIGNQRLELLIRGESASIEPKEKGYGELLFYRNPGRELHLLNSGLLKSDTFKLFIGASPLCSKSHGYQTDAETIAVLLLKENRPFKNKLVIQLINFKTFVPKDFIETGYLTTKAQKTKNGFAFNSFKEHFSPQIGKIIIEGQEYLYQEKDFPLWYEFSGKDFSILPEMTFDKLAWKDMFKDQEDFYQMTEWNVGKKLFHKNIVYYGVNYKLKKKCLLFLADKQQLTGKEAWRCHTI